MSEERYIRLEKETVFGDGGGGTKFQDYKYASESFKSEIEFEDIEEANRATLEESYQSTRKGTGGFDTWGRADSLPLILLALLGQVTIEDIGTLGTAPYKCTFIPKRDDLPSLGIKVGRELKQYAFTGQMMNEVEFTAEAGKPLALSTTLFGIAATAAETKVDSTTLNYIDPTANPVFTLCEASIDLGGANRTDLKSCNLTYSNDFDEDEYAIGKQDYQQKPLGGRRSIEVDMEFAKEDHALFADFIAGTEAVLKLTYTSSVEIEASVPYKLEIVLPRIQYREWDGTTDGRDPVATSVPAVALYERNYTYDSIDYDTEIIAQLVCAETETIN